MEWRRFVTYLSNDPRIYVLDAVALLTVMMGAWQRVLYFVLYVNNVVIIGAQYIALPNTRFLFWKL